METDWKRRLSIAFNEYVYHSEDTLFQVLYDKQYRPDVYSLKLGRIQGTYESLKMKYY